MRAVEMDGKRYRALKKRDGSMLWAALAGFALFVLLAAGINYMVDFGGQWHESTDFDRYFSFPEGTEYEMTDSHGGFLGDGVTLLVAQIPQEASQEFVRLLQEKGFTDAPISEALREKVAGDPDTAAVETANGLWWFEDDSPEGHEGSYMNYTFHMYDPDTCTYYYIEYDS